jgi:hypothetical protein
MKTTNLIFTFSFLLSISFFFNSCGPQTIEQQVEKIMQSEDSTVRTEIAFALADSLSLHPLELLTGLYPDVLAVKATEDMLLRYSQILVEDTLKKDLSTLCISYIIDPSAAGEYALNEQKINFIIYGLQFENNDDYFQSLLVNASKHHGNDALERIVNAWYENTDSKGLLGAILSYGDTAISYLSSKIGVDSNAVDLLARFGNPVVNLMIEKMKNQEQSVRFAAGDVLVRMLKYYPEAVEILTSAIDNGGIQTIEKNYPFYIRLGQSGTEKLLLKALDRYFNEEMCVDYLNCGNSEIETGATTIAAEYGYEVNQINGYHGGPKWNSGN